MNLLHEYFCGVNGYNAWNYTAFGLTLLLFVYLIFKLLKKLKIKIDEKLALSISPFILFGSSVRVLKDAGILTSCAFQTPGIYFITFSIAFSIILISNFLQKRYGIKYYKLTFLSGLFLASPFLGLLKYKNFIGIGYVLLYFLPWLIILKIIPWLLENKIVLSLHLFDATTTYISIHFSGILWNIEYIEQHPIPTYFMNLTGTPFSFVLLKFFIVSLTLLFIDRYSKEKDFNNYLKLLIGILGAATGTRDFLRLFCLV